MLYFVKLWMHKSKLTINAQYNKEVLKNNKSINRNGEKRIK